MNNLTLLTYTHSKCTDLHEAYFGRIQKYFPGLQNNIVTCNVPVSYAECVVYDDDDLHSSQMLKALEKVTTDYVIYSQEDYILFDYVNESKIADYVDLLSKNDNLHFIRLIKSGIGNSTSTYNDELGYVDPASEYYFSTQITVWKKEVLMEMFRRSWVASVFDEPQNSWYLRSIGAIGVYTTQVGTKVGGHYNSLVYPYMATAKVKGRWNLAEYSKEIRALANEYKIQVI